MDDRRPAIRINERVENAGEVKEMRRWWWWGGKGGSPTLKRSQIYLRECIGYSVGRQNVQLLRPFFHCQHQQIVIARCTVAASYLTRLLCALCVLPSRSQQRSSFFWRNQIGSMMMMSGGGVEVRSSEQDSLRHSVVVVCLLLLVSRAQMYVLCNASNSRFSWDWESKRGQSHFKCVQHAKNLEK